MTTSVLSMRVAAAPQRITTGRRTAATQPVRPCTVVRASAAKVASAAVTKAVEKMTTALPVSAVALLATAGPAKADAIQETGAFLQAFWEFRTGDPTSFFTLTVLPILGPYLIFKVLIAQKTEVQLEKLREGKWDVFMSERGLDPESLTLRQLNAYVQAAEMDLLDEEMVAEFVRQREIDEKWAKSTVDVEDPRMEQAKLRARAEKIIAMKEERAKETAKAE